MKIDLEGPPPNGPTIKADVPVSGRILMHLAVDPAGKVLGSYKRLGDAIAALTAAGHQSITLEVGYTVYNLTKEENHG